MAAACAASLLLCEHGTQEGTMRSMRGSLGVLAIGVVLMSAQRAAALLPATPTNPGTVDCTEPQKETIRAAWAIVVRQVYEDQSRLLKACLNDALYQGEANVASVGNAYPEWIMSRLADPEFSAIRCTGQSESVVGPEFINVSGSKIEAGAVETASVILHEIAHTKGLSHYDGLWESAFGPPNLLQTCSRAISAGQPWVKWRSRAQETTLAPVGIGRATLAGFTSAGQTCPGGTFGMGVFGQASSSRIDTLGLICKTPGQTAGNRTWPAQFLASKAPAFELTCSQANGAAVMVGATGAADDLPKGLRALCAMESDVVKNVDARTTTALVGDSWGIGWTRQCPAGAAVKALRVRGYEHVSRIELTCQSLTNPEAITTTYAPWIGGNWGLGWFMEESVFSRDALYELGVIHDGTAIIRFAARSRPVIGSGRSASLQNDERPFPGYGRDTTNNRIAPTRQSCGADNNRALVGVRVNWTAPAIHALQGICAPITGWTSESQLTYLSVQGSTPGQWSQTLCPPNYYMIGYGANASDYLHIFQPICRQF
jgi:hypothetical protein